MIELKYIPMALMGMGLMMATNAIAVECTKDEYYNGILYNENENKKYEGFFKNDKYYNGILYNEIEYKKYEGEFKDNFPKEVNDIKLNDISEYLFYEGNILNYKYDGIGKLNIKEKNIIYKGEFKSGLYEGKGIYIIIILKNMMGNLKMINIILENMKLMLKIIFIYIIKKILKIIKYLEKE